MTAGIFAAIVVGGIAGVIVLLLSIPLDVAFRLRIGEQPVFRFGFRWFFGLVRKDIGGKKRDDERKRADLRKKARKRKEGRGQGLLGFLRYTGFLPDIWRLVRGILRHIRVKSLSADLVIGLDDPADTALLVAALWTPVLLMNPPYAHAVRLQPSFDGSVVLTGRAHMKLRLRPIRIVPPILRFGCSRSGRRLLGGLISGKWRRKS